MAQQTEVVLPFKHILGTERVDVLHKLCFRLLWEKPNRSLVYAQLGIELADSLQYQEGEANLHQDLGNAHLYMGNYEKALASYQKAQYLYDSLQLRTQAIQIKGHIAEVYTEIGEFESAQELLVQTLTDFLAQNDSINLSINYRRYGQLLFHSNKLDSARLIFEKSLTMMRTINDSLGMGLALGALGDVMIEQKDLKTAQKCFSEALEIMQAKEIRVGEIIILLKAAKLYELRQEFNVALQHYQNAIRLANRIEYRSKEMETHLHVSNLYQKKGKYELALDHFRAYVSLKDSVITIAKNQQIADMQVKYQTRSQQQKMEELKLEGRLQRLQILSLAIIASLLIAGFWIWFILKRKAERKLKRQYHEIQRKNQIIKLKREEVEIANKELRKAQQIIHDKNEALLAANVNLEGQVNERTVELQAVVNKLIKTNEELDTFIYRSSHDIKGPLSTLAGLCLLASREIKDPMATSYLEHIQRTVASTMKQLENLMKVYEVKHMTIGYEAFNLVEVLQETVDNKLLNENYCNASINIHAPNKMLCTIDRKMLKLVLNNLLDNSMTYYHELIPPQIDIELSKKQHTIMIDVKDNGIGVLPEVRGKVFNMFFRGSEKSIGSGLGLYIAKLALNRLDGELLLLSSSSKGSHFRIIIPNKPITD
ncbi:MAG: tetratricopeptide repeat protein [Flammeovirgaceae bacterium]